MSQAPQTRMGGFTLVQFLVALTLAVGGAAGTIAYAAIRYDRDVRDRDRSFAGHACRAILAELQTAARAGEDLDALDDAGAAYPTLQLARAVPKLPGEDGSLGNTMHRGGWTWWRSVAVRPLSGTDDCSQRSVTVTLFQHGLDGDGDGDGDREPVASLGGIVSQRSVGFPSRRMLDLYVLAIENIAADEFDLPRVRQLLERELADFEHRNPNLLIRPHWITKASYGRTVRDASPDPNRNPLPYSLADASNHAMRLPAERRFHERRVHAVRERRRAMLDALDRGAPMPPALVDMSEEPTLRLFLQDLNANPDRYRGALILNLHGDVIPVPAVRNFADPASGVAGFSDLRCVTHPEKIRANRVDEFVHLRVYAWVEDLARVPQDGTTPEDSAIVLRIAGVDLTDPSRAGRLRRGVRIQNLAGGVARTRGGAPADSTYRPFARARTPGEPSLWNEMFYTAAFVDPGFGEPKHTRIDLYRTPVTCPPRRHGDVWQGLSTSARRYGVEHDPRPNVPNLAADGRGAKNTARWRLTLSPSLLRQRCFVSDTGRRDIARRDVRLDITTSFRRYDDEESPDPSTTHVWWTADPTGLPLTEQASLVHGRFASPYPRDPAQEPLAAGLRWFRGALLKSGATYASLGPFTATRLLAGDDAARLFPARELFHAPLGERVFGIENRLGRARLMARGRDLATAFQTHFEPLTTVAGTIGWLRVKQAIPPRADHCRVRVDEIYYGLLEDQARVATARIEIARGRSRAFVCVDRSVASHEERLQRALCALVDRKLRDGMARGLQILAPTAMDRLVDPERLELQFHTIGGRPYARPAGERAAPGGVSEADLYYRVLYSADGGRAWRHVQDDSPARLGERPTAKYLTQDRVSGPERWTCALPEGRFAAGSYLLRVEAFVKAARQHAAHHQTRVVIRRSARPRKKSR